MAHVKVTTLPFEWAVYDDDRFVGNVLRQRAMLGSPHWWEFVYQFSGDDSDHTSPRSYTSKDGAARAMVRAIRRGVTSHQDDD